MQGTPKAQQKENKQQDQKVGKRSEPHPTKDTDDTWACVESLCPYRTRTQTSILLYSQVLKPGIQALIGNG